nr:hypothetical protein GCM10010200_073060 [Actinomadura rugatobispora]
MNAPPPPHVPQYVREHHRRPGRTVEAVPGSACGERRNRFRTGFPEDFLSLIRIKGAPGAYAPGVSGRTRR